MTETVLSARRVRKRFRLREGEILALKELDLDVQENEFICIVGPSGCGKSTFLRMAAGLEPVSEGEILYRGQPVKVPRREVGMVFQEYSLLPWRTVEDNVALGLEFAGTRWRVNTWSWWILPHLPVPCPMSFPAACGNVWPSRGPWPTGPMCC